MRVMMLLVALGPAAVFAAQAQAGSDEPVELGALDMDRVTAGAFGGGTAAGAIADSDFIAATFTDGGVVIDTKEDPQKGSLQGVSGVTGGDAIAVTIGGGGSRGVGVETELGGDGFELARIEVGGSVNGPIASYESETVVVVETVVNPFRFQ